MIEKTIKDAINHHEKEIRMHKNEIRRLKEKCKK